MLLLKANAITFSMKNCLKSTLIGFTRQSSSSKSMVVLSEDRSTYLCWHPEPEFPYEHTKPMPREEEEIRMGDTELKVQYMLEEKYKYSPDGPSQKELMKMFYTTRHVFDPKPSLRYRNKKPPKDRESI